MTANSPGELSSWAAKTARSLRDILPEARIVLALVPCPFASGAEAETAEKLGCFDVIIKPWDTIKAILGFMPSYYRPAERCAVIYLGGEPWHALLLAKRLNAPVSAYAVRSSVFHRFFDKIAAFEPDLADKLQKRGLPAECIGNLSLDGVTEAVAELEAKRTDLRPTVGIFPGSRLIHMRAALGPFLEFCCMLRAQNPDIRFILSVSPYITPAKLDYALRCPFDVGAKVASGKICGNKIICYDGTEAELVWSDPYRVIAEMDAAFTIPGTNTGEIACCGKPMVLPLSAGAPVPRGGLSGLLEYIPLLILKKYMRRRSYLRHKFVAQPNRLAKRMIVPEIVVEGDMTPPVKAMAQYLEDKELWSRTGAELKKVMGAGRGAARRMAEIAAELL
ncbi:MAG: hypothetical protein K6G50_05325 [bacterium]|nr:hypothetical protein [bacterium]